jgi:probable H4MPT-linked C1 transfer pathway protein
LYVNPYNVLMATQVLGLDIGGANIKAAHSDGTARTVRFPLWKHPEQLTGELAALCATMPRHDMLAITMTGELCDCFPTKRAGVRAILQSVRAAAIDTTIRVWCTGSHFLTLDEAMEIPLSVAAANWLAEAHSVARQFPSERVMLIDTGSTTTDIVYLNRGIPEPRAFTDVDRLSSGELVYTGIRRTPVCGVLGMEVASEFFTTMLDAYVIQGHLPENSDDCDTADGRPITRAAAHARLARMRCADVETFSEAQARSLAEHAIAVQRMNAVQAYYRVLADRADVNRVVVAGSGEILGRLVAKQCGKPATSLAEVLAPSLSEAACAFAVAKLAAEGWA